MTADTTVVHRIESLPAQVGRDRLPCGAVVRHLTKVADSWSMLQLMVKHEAGHPCKRCWAGRRPAGPLEVLDRIQNLVDDTPEGGAIPVERLRELLPPFESRKAA